MGKFNKKQENQNKATTHEDGEGYIKNPVENWLNMLFSSYCEDKFYEGAKDQLARYNEIMEQIAIHYGYEMVAKCAAFARNELGMRSIAQYTAAYLNDKQFNNKRAFFRNFNHRPDDVSEIFACVDSLTQKRSHALVRGCGDYLSSLGEYQLGKYKLNGKEYNMYDLINITHANSAAIDKYKADCLETSNTWEVKISTAENDEARKANWMELLRSHSLGYLALIRNLNNLVNAAETEADIEEIADQIYNKEAIIKSLVFPYQIYTAYQYLYAKPTSIVEALSKAFKHAAMYNMPEFIGDNLIMLDVSGSMDDPISRGSKVSIKEVGACFAVSLWLTQNADVVKFGTSGVQWGHSSTKFDNVFTLIESLCNNENLGFGTQIDAAYKAMREKHYDRIFLISDMQIMSPELRWYCGGTYDIGAICYEDYCRNYGVAELYSFDLGNYTSQTDNPNNPHVHLLTALNEKVFQFIKLVDEGEDIVKVIQSAVTNTYQMAS